MKMDALQKEWEKILENEGMPENIKPEEQKAAEAGYEISSLDIDPESDAIAKKLQSEDSRNLFSGFPNSIEMVKRIVETTREDWMAQGIKEKDIQLAIHESCENGHDCVVLSYANGNRYHYNTKNIMGYSRDALENSGLTFVEK